MLRAAVCEARARSGRGQQERYARSRYRLAPRGHHPHHRFMPAVETDAVDRAVPFYDLNRGCVLAGNCRCGLLRHRYAGNEKKQAERKSPGHMDCFIP